MKTAINIYFCDYDTKTKLDAIKSNGFDGVMLLYGDEATMTLREQVDYCKKIGLEVIAIHGVYDEDSIRRFVTTNDTKEDYYKQLIYIKDLGVKNFIIHCENHINLGYSEYGLNNIKSLLELCNKYDINLCLENLYTQEMIDYYFDNIKDKYLKLCYDCGHRHCFSNGANYERHFPKTTVMHLHNNYGESDDHNNLNYGTIDMENLSREILMIKDLCGFLTLEVKYKDISKFDSIDQILKEAKNSLNLLNKEVIE